MRLRADRPGKPGPPAGEDRRRRRSVGLRADLVGCATAGRGDRESSAAFPASRSWRWTRRPVAIISAWAWLRPISRHCRRRCAQRARCRPGRCSAHPLHVRLDRQPKGVVISHRNVASFLEWAVAYFGIDGSDRLSGHAPFHFDLSTFDVYGALTTGSELHLVPPELGLMPRDLAALIDREQLTQWFSVPSVLSYMANFDAVPDGGFASLRRVIWCGDVLPTPVLKHWMDRIAHVQYTNLYGPTETTIASSYYMVTTPPEDETKPIPIGVACAGEELLVLDDKLQPVPPEATGDLYIGGSGLSSGYWRDDAKTHAAFIADPRSPHGDRRLYRTGDRAEDRR